MNKFLRAGVVAIITLISIVSARAEEISVHGIRYIIDGDSAIVTKGDYKQVNVIIPDTFYVENKLYHVVSVGQYAFYATPVEVVKLPGSIVRTEFACFSNCDNLLYFRLPEGLEQIGAYTFSASVRLRDVVIPSTTTTICEGAFNECYQLQQITCLATTPPTFEDNTFYCVPKSLTVYVPYGYSEVYKNSAWKIFTIIELPEEYTNIPTIKAQDNMPTFDISGRRVNPQYKGLIIENGTKRIVL